MSNPERHEVKCTCGDCERRVKTTFKKDGDKIVITKRVHGKVHEFRIDRKKVSG